MNKKRPTIIDVAHHAGVSKSTVSLVLQDSVLVKPETRKLVETAIANIGYVYNRNAAKLRSDQTGLVGLVINDLRNPFFTEFATSLQMCMAAEGYATVVANTDECETTQEQVVKSMVEHGVSALVISPAYTSSNILFEHTRRANIPTFQVLRQINPDVDAFPFFSFDYEYGSRLAIQHLQEIGCKNIAFVGGIEGSPITLERMKGYVEFLDLHGAKPNIFFGKPSKYFGKNIAIQITEQQPEIDGFYCFNDLVALGMNSGFLSKNRIAGKDIFLIGFDDIEECQHSYPPLTSINCKISDFGRYVATSLLRHLTSGENSSSIYRAPVSLVKRESTLAI